MEMPVLLKIILPDDSCQRLSLPNGIPATIDELYEEVGRQCVINGTFKLQFMDRMFSNEFFNITSLTEVENRGTLKVIRNTNTSLVVQDTENYNQCRPSTSQDVSFVSDGSADTDILSSAESTSSRSSWPDIFIVPKFSFDAEIQLQQGNLNYAQDGSLLTLTPKLKTTILSALVQKIVKHKVYASSMELEQVAASLIQAHPCLKQNGYHTGYGGWKKSLVDKMSNYRSYLRKIGCPEVTVNSIQSKPEGKRKAEFAALGIKKPKRAEVNFCPSYPKDCEETLEEMQKSLLLHVKKRNKAFVKIKMEKTFPLRRHEVVRDAPMVENVMERWPALFDVSEINAEFQRITTVPLDSRFMSQLDLFSGKLEELFKRRGGKIGEQLRQIITGLTDCDVDSGREHILAGICVYMGEDPKNLIQEYVDMDENSVDEAIEETVVGVFRQRTFSSTEDNVGVVLEGVKVLQDMASIPHAIVMLFGLLYCLNINYPSTLRYTFEVFQKILMELDANKLSKKAGILKNKLLE